MKLMKLLYQHQQRRCTQGVVGEGVIFKKKFVDKNAIKLKIVYPHPLRFRTNGLAPSPKIF
jgi:hypothetical protein